MKSGTQHWWIQRLSAVLLIALSYWLLAFLWICLHSTYFETSQWLTNPINVMGLLSWVLVVCYHASIGLQVVIEDYISRGKQLIGIWTLHTLFAGIGLVAIVSLL